MGDVLCLTNRDGHQLLPPTSINLNRKIARVIPQLTDRREASHVATEAAEAIASGTNVAEPEEAECDMFVAVDEESEEEEEIQINVTANSSNEASADATASGSDEALASAEADEELENSESEKRAVVQPNEQQ